MSKPLEGIVVLDMSRVLSAPFTGMILADMGADVIIVPILPTWKMKVFTSWILIVASVRSRLI